VEALLVAVRGPLKGRRFSLSNSVLGIGRSPKNEVSIADMHVSQVHAIVQSIEGAIVVTDQQSSNGTFVNGSKVDRRELAHGDRIEIGASEFTFISDPPIIRFENSDFAASAEQTIEMSIGEFDYPFRTPREDGSTDRTVRDLQVLLEISQRITSLRKSDDIQEALLAAVIQAVPAEKVAILIPAEKLGEFSCRLARHRDGMVPDIRVSKNVCRRVLASGKAELLNNIQASPDASISLVESGITSMVCVPINAPHGNVGIIHADTSDPQTGFDDRHLQLLMSLALIGASALQQALYVEWLEAESELLASSASVASEMVGDSAEMKDLQRLIGQYAPSTAPVLIEGETGTGKEVAARAIHRNSRRASGPLLDVNCSILQKERAESELFGHERGAFTDARSRHYGFFERADGGTLFLDEIGDLTVDVQKMLLRVLQEKTIRRMGGTESIPVDVRVIAATNRDLREMMAQGTFRNDLYERLCVVHITIPPLRERKDDIPALAYHFIRKYSLKEGRDIAGLTPTALKSLRNYSWPHNIRELENRIWRSVLDAKSDRIDVGDLPKEVLGSIPDTASGEKTLEQIVRDAKKAAVRDSLRQSSGNVKQAAKILGLEPNSLSRLITELGLREKNERG
jgi:DNA-binding NtrC family response regulator